MSPVSVKRRSHNIATTLAAIVCATLVAIITGAAAHAETLPLGQHRTLIVRSDGIGAPALETAPGEAPRPQLVDRGQCTLFAEGITSQGRVTLWTVDKVTGVKNTRVTYTDVGQNGMLRNLVADVPTAEVRYQLVWTGMDDGTKVIVLDDVTVHNQGACATY